MAEMTENEQKGYNAWIELWAETGYAPGVHECPARWMREGPERSEFLRGWGRAKRENQGS